MNLYEIDTAINTLLEDGYDNECINPETGEFIEERVIERLEELSIARSEKIESVACFIKNLAAQSAAIKREEVHLAERRNVIDNRIEGLKKYLSSSLNGEKYNGIRAAISWRKSAQLIIDDADKIPSEYVTEQLSVSVDKNAIKAAIRNGEKIDGAHIENRLNIQIR